MSGIRGVARKGKIRITAQVQFAETGKTIKTHVFVKADALAMEVVEKIGRKFYAEHTVINARKTDEYSFMFQKAAA